MKTIFQFFVFVLFACLGNAYAATASLPEQREYAPAQGKGQVVVVISGQQGPGNYQSYAKSLAGQGYYVVLVDSNDFWQKEGGKELLQGVITNAQQSSHALPGKGAVIGFSLGGGVALNLASKMADLLAAVVVCYPATSHIHKPDAFVKRFEVPMLFMAAVRDTYKNCCTIEKAHELNTAARALNGDAGFQFVEYPDADHGFTIESGKTYRKSDADDAFQRTLEFLRQHMGK